MPTRRCVATVCSRAARHHSTISHIFSHYAQRHFMRLPQHRFRALSQRAHFAYDIHQWFRLVLDLQWNLALIMQHQRHLTAFAAIRRLSRRGVGVPPWFSHLAISSSSWRKRACSFLFSSGGRIWGGADAQRMASSHSPQAAPPSPFLLTCGLGTVLFRQHFGWIVPALKLLASPQKTSGGLDDVPSSVAIHTFSWVATCAAIP